MFKTIQRGSDTLRVLGLFVTGVLLAGSLVALSLASAEPSQAAAASSATGGLFTPLQKRIYDTRSTTYAGNTGSKLNVGQWYPVTVAGVGGAPTSGIAAVQVTLTEVNAASSGSLKADATGVADPNTTVPSLIWADGKESNAATIPVGANGKFQIYVNASTDIVIDLQGFYSSGATAAGGYVPTANKKILGSSSTSYTSSTPLTLQVTGAGDVPAGASAVMLSILIIPTDTTAGNLQVYPTGTPPTTPWLLNWSSSENAVFTSAVSLPASGKVTIAVQSGSVALQVAVQGYFKAASAGTAAGAFTPQRARVMDTRSNVALAPDETRLVQVAGTKTLPLVEDGLGAVAANVVVYPGTGSSSRGSVLVSASDEVENFWTQFFYPGETVSGFSVTKVGADGAIKIHNSSNTSVDIVIDSEGYYTSPILPTISCPTPYAPGSWTAARPSSPIACTVTEPQNDVAGNTLDITVDGEALPPVTPSTAGTVSQAVNVTQVGGRHVIQATVTRNDYSYVQASYSFGTGDWTTDTFSPLPAVGALAYTQTELSVTPSNDSFTEDTQFRYVVSASANPLANPTVDSGWGASDFAVPSGALQAGSTYYWVAQISGPAGGRSTSSLVTTPVYSFTANANNIDPTCGAAVLETATAHQVTPSESDYTDNCIITVSSTEGDAETASTSSIQSDPSLSQQQKAQMTAAVAAGKTVHRVDYTTAHEAWPLWRIEMTGRIYWDGDMAWTTKRRGYTGFQICDQGESYANGYNVSVQKCSHVKTGSNETTEDQFMNFSISFLVKGFAGTQHHSMYTKVTKDGKMYSGKGTGF